MLQFCMKLWELVQEAEGRKPDSLKDLWRWIKGLLTDYLAAKNDASEVQKKLLYESV